MLTEDPIQLLARVPLFSTLPPQAIRELGDTLRAVEVRCGEALIRQGEPGSSLFLVVDGRFEARAEDPSQPPRVLGVIGRGEIVGETAVITSEPRNCSVIATRRSSVLELSGDGFLAVLQRYPAELLGFTRRLLQRAARPSASSPTRTIALLPLDSEVDLAWLGGALADALSRYGSTVRLGRALALQKAHGDPSGTIPRLASSFLEWLDRKERSHDFAVYEAMHALGEWTRRCLAQADVVLLVGRANGSPAATKLEQMLLGSDNGITLAPVHLVLLREDRAKRPSGTAAWLDARRVDLHHHVALGDQADVERLARILSGRSIHLVLSGGGARGFAEAGVMRAMQEGGLPIDFVGGASMGASMAAFCAMEWDGRRMHDGCRRFVDARVKDVTFPFIALIAARRGSRAVRELCEGWLIEDLPIGYFAVSVDLCRAEEVIHRRGPLWLAMRSSAAIPGVLPPIITDDACLVDGGVLNNLPVDVMARLAPGRIVAVDVSRESALDLVSARSVGAGADGSASGWRLLLRRLFGRHARPALHIGDLLARANEVASIRIARSVQARTPIALRIEPPVDHFRMLDFDAVDAIVEAGYRFGSEHVEAWKAALLPAPRRTSEPPPSAEIASSRFEPLPAP
jgi:NTE family protein/lysophospholipid hydrolase